MQISDKAQAHRAGQCDGLLGRNCESPYKQPWLAKSYLAGYLAGKEYRQEHNITLEIPGINPGDK